MQSTTNICFLANFTKTQLFHRLAEELTKSGIRTFWIATNRKIFAYLQKHYPEQHLLLLNRDQIKKTAQPVADFKLNELIYGDRVLRYEPLEGLAFLQNIQQPIADFISSHRIRFVFGEITWAHEVLIHRMCSQVEELNCKFLNPHVVRIPNNRFAFFEDERQSKLLENPQPQPWEKEMLQIKKPNYLKINDKRLKKATSILGRLDRLKRFFTNENMDSKDPTLLSHSWHRFRTRTAEEWNRETYKLVKRVDFEILRGRPYVFLGLHKQPEASVDVFGRYYEDQMQNIQNLWRALPSGWNLLLKEHTNAIGDRRLNFYKKLSRLPNLYFVHERTNSFELIRQAKLVATITGTIAFEAALMHVPAVTFAPVFFNRLNSCRQINLEDLAACPLQALVEELSHQPDNRLAFSKYLMQNSFAGNLTDPISDPGALKSENISSINRAFEIIAKKSPVLTD